MVTVGSDYLGCIAARKLGVCGNSGSIRRGELEVLVTDALRTRLMAPDLVAEFVQEFTAEWNRAVAEASAGRDGIARELAAVERKVNGLISAIADGFLAVGLHQQLERLEAQRIKLTAKLSAPEPAQRCVHPNIARVFKVKVERLQDALQAGPDRLVFRALSRAVITIAYLSHEARSSLNLFKNIIFNLRKRNFCGRQTRFKQGSERLMFAVGSHKYGTDLTDDQWRIIKSYIPLSGYGGRRCETDPRRVVDAIFYFVKAGCTWRLLPSDFPPWQTVYRYFQRWEKSGVWQKIHLGLAGMARAQIGRTIKPTALAIDSQSVKNEKLMVLTRAALMVASV